jgi:hypothetical protein
LGPCNAFLRSGEDVQTYIMLWVHIVLPGAGIRGPRAISFVSSKAVRGFRVFVGANVLCSYTASATTAAAAERGSVSTNR